MANPLELNLSPKAESDFRALLEERGFPTINEFVIDALKQDAAKKRAARLGSISDRMFPNGAPDPGASS